MAGHDAAVKAISTAVRGLYNRRETFRIFHGSTNSTRPSHSDRKIDISALRNILKVDTIKRCALVEPNVPMDRLIEATLAHGLMPPVVMEFPGITAGGGFSGSAGESSSFKYGYFDQTVNWVEIVLANGEIVRASKVFIRPFSLISTPSLQTLPSESLVLMKASMARFRLTIRPKEENADLFRGAAGSLGTLGITTLMEIQLIPSKKFVQLTYHRKNSIKNATYSIRRETENESNDFVDGIVFSKDLATVMTGKLTDDKPPSIQARTFSRPFDPWFYMHVKDKISAKKTTDAVSLPHELDTYNASDEPLVDYIPIADYLFRWDRGGFWMGQHAFDYFPLIPFNRLTRWFLDDFMHTRMLYRALHSSRTHSFEHIVQDLSLPYPTAAKFIEYTASELDVWPLWLCPLRQIQRPTFHPSTVTGEKSEKEAEAQPMLNIGLWGTGSKDRGEFLRQNRELESKLAELGGMKVLYSHTYYTEEEFWQIYDRKWYDDLRRRYEATSLPSVYEKVKMDMSSFSAGGEPRTWKEWLWSVWPLAGLVGIRSAIKSRDYLLHRKPGWMYRRDSEN